MKRNINMVWHIAKHDIPSHDSDIILLRPKTSFGFIGFEPKETRVEYCWSELDENGIHTGSLVGYSGEDSLCGCSLLISDSDGESIDGECLWMYVSEYDSFCENCFRDEIRREG